MHLAILSFLFTDLSQALETPDKCTPTLIALADRREPGNSILKGAWDVVCLLSVHNSLDAIPNTYITRYSGSLCYPVF